MDCPRCGKSLKATQVAEGDVAVQALRCAGCAGQLFARADLRKLEETVVLRPFESPTQIPTMRTQRKALKCPSCQDAPWMRKASNQRHEEVIMDVCPACDSVWLDGGELERIREEGLFSTIVQCVRWLRGA